MNNKRLRFFLFILSSCLLCLGCGGESSNRADASSRSTSSVEGTISERDIAGSYDPNSFVAPEINASSFDWMGRGIFDFTIRSDITGVSYRYDIYLPPEYDLEPEKEFPVLYVTDGQYDATFHAKVLDFEDRQVVMVIIFEGPTAAINGRRAVDYIMPGAQDYFRFFTEEFMPVVEERYRISSVNRSFLGASAGGQLALVMAALDYEDPALFRNHLIFDPWNTVAVNGLFDERAASSVPFNKKFFISSAASGKGGFENTVRPFTARLREREITGLELHERVYNVSHFDVTWASLSTAFELLFDEDKTSTSSTALRGRLSDLRDPLL